MSMIPKLNNVILKIKRDKFLFARRIAIFAFGCIVSLHAQYIDYWTGNLNVGINLQIQFNVTYQLPNPTYISMDIPDQSVWELQCTLLKWSSDSFNISIPDIGVIFRGHKLNGDSIADGIWSQNGYAFPITLQRSFNDIKPYRPQHPTGETDYLIEELSVFNAVDNVYLHAVLTIPKGYKMKGCAVMVSGSGKQDYDETIAGHKPFWVIADYLTKNGYAVIRFDDRGGYRSTGDFEHSTIFNFANDVNAIIDMAKERTGITQDSKIGLIGHSEGSMVSQIVLKNRPLGFFISLAGPGVPLQELMLKQNEEFSPLMGISDKDFQKSVGPVLKNIFKVVANTKIDSAVAGLKIKSILHKQESKLPEAFKARFSLGTEGENGMIGEMLTKPFRAFLSFNPADYLSVIKTPVLALNGSKDLQVYANANLDGFKKFITNNSHNEVVLVDGKNHLFQQCETGQISEYGKIDETFSSEVLSIMLQWLNKIQ